MNLLSILALEDKGYIDSFVYGHVLVWPKVPRIKST